MMLMRVDLPAPFSPNRTWTSPWRRSKSTPSSATTPGKRFEMLPSSRRRPWPSAGVAATADASVTAATVTAGFAAVFLRLSWRLDGIDRAEVGRRQHQAHVDLVEVAQRDHVGDRLGALDIR